MTERIHCEKCAGEGWIIGEDNNPRHCPVCQEARIRERLRKSANLSEAELRFRLGATFKPLPGKEKALALARRLLEKRAGFVTLWGDYGTGKTTLLKTVCAEIVEFGLSARYDRVADVLGTIRRTFDRRNGETSEQILERYRRVPVLALDEVDRVKLSDWAQEMTFRLMDERYQQAETRLTLLALNTAPDDLPAELGYLASRMHGGVILEMGGADVRPALGLAATRGLLAETS